MKKIVISLIALTSLSAFSAETCEVIHSAIKNAPVVGYCSPASAEEFLELKSMTGNKRVEVISKLEEKGFEFRTVSSGDGVVSTLVFVRK